MGKQIIFDCCCVLGHPNVHCMLYAYFGSNAEILGNIKNSYFPYTAVEDVRSSFQMLCIIIGIDIVLLIISYATRYKFDQIDLLNVNEFCALFL